MTVDIGRMLADIGRRLAKVEAQSRLKSASIDDAALVVRDGTGSLRGIVGQQGDGTTAVTIVNGPPPPQPTTPIVLSVLGGVAASWDGQFTDGQVLPLDWSRIEVHASTDPGFVPVAGTLHSTIETAQGATVIVATDDPVYVRLLARSTSGTASPPSASVGPNGPAPVVATELLDGIVTTLKLADDAVTSAKLAVAAVDTTALADGAVLTEKLANAAVAVGKLADNAVTGPAIAADAVTAGKISTDAVTAREIAAGSITTAEVAAGAITTDKLTVTGGTNILADPSFEGPATEALVANVPFWSVDPTKGNGSSKSLLVDATAGAATNRQITLATIAVIPGDQLYLAFDYQTSSDYNGTRVRFYARWHNAAGGTLGYTIADSGAPPVIGGTGWSRPTATGTAPADATRADIVALSLGASAGFVWLDNAVLRTVVGGTQIQDGAITTAKIVAGAVQTDQLDAESVNASKIAAGAVTTAKLDALAVTADKIAANTITTAKLAAGSVDATALKADAITGKTITGGTINGAEFHSDDGAGGLVDIQSGTVLTTASTGWQIAIDPSKPQPAIVWLNDTGVIAGEINGMGDSTRPGLVLSSGPFTDGVITDWRWATRSGADGAINGWRTGRFRESDENTILGGYINLAPDRASLAWVDTDNSATNTILQITQGLFTFDEGRFVIEPPASTSSAFYITAKSGHTGNLIRAQVNLVDQFVVSAAGAVSAQSVTTTGNATIGGTLGTVNVTVSGQITKDATWSTLSTGTGWAGYGGAYGTGRYRRMPDGSIIIRDLVKRTATTTITSGEIVATLPVGYRPTTTVQQNIFVGGSTGGSLSININTDGTITLSNFSSGATTYLSTGSGYISLNGYQFFTD